MLFLKSLKVEMVEGAVSPQRGVWGGLFGIAKAMP